MVVSPRWRQFCCPRCGRVISECKPLGTDTRNTLPTVEMIDSCAICGRAPKDPVDALTKDRVMGAIEP